MAGNEPTFADLAAPASIAGDLVTGGLVQAGDVLRAWYRSLGAEVCIHYDALNGRAEMSARFKGGRVVELGLTAAEGTD